MKYFEYLGSEAWLAKKDEYRNSSRPQYCLICENARFDLHHLNHDNLGKESLHKDVAPFCRACHTVIHSFLKSHKLKVSSTFEYLPMMFNLPKSDFIRIKNLYPWFSKDLDKNKFKAIDFIQFEMPPLTPRKGKKHENWKYKAGKSRSNKSIDAIKRRIEASFAEDDFNF